MTKKKKTLRAAVLASIFAMAFSATAWAADPDGIWVGGDYNWNGTAQDQIERDPMPNYTEYAPGASGGIDKTVDGKTIYAYNPTLENNSGDADKNGTGNYEPKYNYYLQYFAYRDPEPLYVDRIVAVKMNEGGEATQDLNMYGITNTIDISGVQLFHVEYLNDGTIISPDGVNAALSNTAISLEKEVNGQKVSHYCGESAKSVSIGQIQRMNEVFYANDKNLSDGIADEAQERYEADQRINVEYNETTNQLSWTSATKVQETDDGGKLLYYYINNEGDKVNDISAENVTQTEDGGFKITIDNKTYTAYPQMKYKDPTIWTLNGLQNNTNNEDNDKNYKGLEIIQSGENAGKLYMTVKDTAGNEVTGSADIGNYIQNNAGDAYYYEIDEDGNKINVNNPITINQAITEINNTIGDTTNLGVDGDTIVQAINNTYTEAKKHTTLTQGDNIIVTPSNNENGGINYEVKTAQNVTFETVNTSTLNAQSGNIQTLYTDTAHVVTVNAQTINAATANVLTANIQTANVNTLNALTGNIQTINTSTLNAQTGNVQTLNTATANVLTANIQTANVDTLNALTGNIQTINTSTLNAQTGNVQTLNTATANVMTANIQTANVDTLNALTGNLQTTNTEVVNLGTKNGGTDIRYDTSEGRITYNNGAEKIANLNDGYYYTGDITTQVNGENPYADLTGKTIKVYGGATTDLVSTTKNIGVTTTQTNAGIEMNLQLAKDLGGFESISVPGANGKDGEDGTTITNEGIVITGPKGDSGKDGKDGTVTIKHDQVDVGGNRIENVADGVNPTDAVNVRQLDKLGNRVDKVGAGAAALAALHPLDFDPDDKLSFSAGVGNYGGETASALGMFYRPTEKVMLSAAGTMGNGENMVNMGVTFALDRKNNVSNSRVAMAREIQDLREQVAALTALVTQLAGRNNPVLIDTVMFPDVPENHWAYDYIEGLQKRGIVEGYPDGNFGGDRSMTRYEYAAMLYRALEKGFPVDSRLLDEFDAELGRIRVDRIKGLDDDGNKIERVRVNQYEGRDDYGSKLTTVNEAE